MEVTNALAYNKSLIVQAPGVNVAKLYNCSALQKNKLECWFLTSLFRFVSHLAARSEPT